MKKKIIFLALCMVVSCLNAAPTPIPAPKMSYSKACDLVLEADKNPYDSNWKKTFPRSMVYTSLKHSEELQRFVYEWNSKEIIEKKKMEWILNEWGWLITVVKGNDLSQTNTYFVRESGELRLLWATE